MLRRVNSTFKKSIWTFVFIRYIYFCTDVFLYTKIQNNIHEKNSSWWTSGCSCWSGQRFPSTSHLMFTIAMHRGKNLLECHTHPLQWCPHMQHSWHSNRDIWSCSLWSYAFHLHTQTTVVIVLWAIYIYILPNLVTVNGWLKFYCNYLFIYLVSCLADAFIQSDLQMRTLEQLELICQFSRHYKQGQCQIFMDYTCVYTHFW